MPMHATRQRRHMRLVAAVAVLIVAATACQLPLPAPGSVLIGCDQASQQVAVSVTSHLDPDCTYTGGFD